MYLKLRWARFFALAGWHWTLGPRNGYFDFRLNIPCHTHCEDGGSHWLLVRVCEETHKALVAKHGDLWDIDFIYSEPHPALFGYGPQNTHWQMVHGDGGRDYSLNCLCPGLVELWERASRE